MGQIHNKAIFEQRGFVNVAAMFSEFVDSERTPVAKDFNDGLPHVRGST